MGIPNPLYHATAQCLEDVILREGLHTPWGEVYLSANPDDCVGFVGSRLIKHVHGIQSVTLSNGEEIHVPELVVHDHIVVFTIDTDQLNPDALYVGTDHNPAFFPEDISSFVYDGAIPLEAIIEVTYLLEELS